MKIARRRIDAALGGFFKRRRVDDRVFLSAYPPMSQPGTLFPRHHVPPMAAAYFHRTDLEISVATYRSLQKTPMPQISKEVKSRACHR